MYRNGISENNSLSNLAMPETQKVWIKLVEIINCISCLVCTTKPGSTEKKFDKYKIRIFGFHFYQAKIKHLSYVSGGIMQSVTALESESLEFIKSWCGTP